MRVIGGIQRTVKSITFGKQSSATGTQRFAILIAWEAEGKRSMRAERWAILIGVMMLTAPLLIVARA
ncbi:MAG: hypothetical protein WAK67_00120, partial [Xanthobacteraceae bacterium]